MRRTILWHTAAGLVLAGLAILSAGCRKELCYDHDEHAFSVKVNLAAAWEREWERDLGMGWKNVWEGKGWNEWIPYDNLRPGVPTGIRAVVYEENGGHDVRNLASGGGRLYMNEGRYSILFYNNDTEYIVFDGQTSSATMTATTRTRTRAGFNELHEEERTVNQPDMLYGAYIAEYEAKPTSEPDELPATMHPLTYTYVLRYEFSHGAQYIALARGALAGMAESVYLQDGHTGSNTATILFDEDACSLTDFGVQARIRSFGAPDYPGSGYGRTGKRYSMSLQVILKNGKDKNFTFDVTDQVTSQPRGGVIVVPDLVITDEEGESGGSGFDVNVGDWGDTEDIVLPI
ncbi:DUF5119 domain-containing protein [Alistipes indistinctus]|uniref:DUF5119 domain-containing protein n=1 Tax=Alistipes indistinctus TaxID=626932 RepID=UPI003AB63486